MEPEVTIREPAATLQGHDEHEPMNLPVLVGYLLVLTAATFMTLYISFWGPITNSLIVLAIGFCKATVVVGFFMHFRYEKSWKYFLTLPTCVLAVVAVTALVPDVAIGAYPKVSWVFTN